MTKEDLNKLYQDLTQEEAIVKKQLEDTEQPGMEMEGPHPKRPDLGDETDEDAYSHEVAGIEQNLAISQELRKHLEGIEKAKKKIESGAYGKCENCSLDIHPERLKATPIAALCMDCARKIQ
ncbi:TraR/DksA C4-type zinc finger protein [Candidatus Parcubacteria bacterium]|nr:TraR/DksA C4-type zinc finger protein [Candidatus Parcubacteria bacterium]